MPSSAARDRPPSRRPCGSPMRQVPTGWVHGVAGSRGCRRRTASSVSTAGPGATSVPSYSAKGSAAKAARAIRRARISGLMSSGCSSRCGSISGARGRIGAGEADRAAALGIERDRANRVAVAERERDLRVGQPPGRLEHELHVGPARARDRCAGRRPTLEHVAGQRARCGSAGTARGARRRAGRTSPATGRSYVGLSVSMCIGLAGWSW